MKHTLIGLTGRIGSGKSAVAQIWAESSARVISADQLAKECLDHNEDFKQKLRGLFGSRIFKEGSQQIDRGALGKLIFNDEDAYLRFDGLIIPMIQAQFRSQLELSKAEGAELIVYDAPTLFKYPAQLSQFSALVLVTARENISVERVLKRDPQRNDAEIRQIMARQLPNQIQIKIADYVIENNHTLAELKQAALAVLRQISTPVRDS